MWYAYVNVSWWEGPASAAVGGAVAGSMAVVTTLVDTKMKRQNTYHIHHFAILALSLSCGDTK